jgi:hypothetical protein
MKKAAGQAFWTQPAPMGPSVRACHATEILLHSFFFAADPALGAGDYSKTLLLNCCKPGRYQLI